MKEALIAVILLAGILGALGRRVLWVRLLMIGVLVVAALFHGVYLLTAHRLIAERLQSRVSTNGPLDLNSVVGAIQDSAQNQILLFGALAVSLFVLALVPQGAPRQENAQGPGTKQSNQRK